MNRDEFCKLTGLDNDLLKNRVRRNQLPVADGLREREGRIKGVYDPSEALLTVMSEELALEGKVSLGAAAEIIGPAWQDLFLRVKPHHHFKAIASSSLAIVKGKRADEILAGRVWHWQAPEPISTRHWHIGYCGTLGQIVEQMGKLKAPVVQMIFGNASRAGALMRERAELHGIDLSEFWARAD